MKIEKENLETIKPDLSPLFYEMRELDSLNNEKTEKVIEAFKDAEVKNWPDGSWGTFYLVTSGNLYEQLKSLGLDESSTLSFKAYRELSNLEQKENKTMDDYSKISQIKSRNLDVLDNVDNLLKKYDIGQIGRAHV